MYAEECREILPAGSELETLIRYELRVKERDRGAQPITCEKLMVSEVSKRFRVRGGYVEALANVSLSVREGEFVCLVGPSGCGKSTLLSIIAGLEHPSRGLVVADGKPIGGAGPDRMVIFQEPALFPWLTIQENVEFGLRMRGMPRAERAQRAMEGLRQVDLADFAHTYVHQLSGGMKQRAALARALVLSPDLLLLDEPFAALDVQSRDLLHQELLDVWARTGKTIIFVTHNVQEALRLADRIVVFSARPGRVVREFPVLSPRPRPVEQGSLGEVGEEIRNELRVALAASREGGGGDVQMGKEGSFFPDPDCGLGIGG